MTPAATTAERPQFWSDDFDIDLLKVFPDVPKMLRDPERILWTVGHTSYGRLNHPTTWDHAFLWLRKPTLARDKNGWFDIDSRVSNEPEVECTWLEWLRDAWVHRYGAMVMPFRRLMPASPEQDFEAIMWDLRGWNRRALTGSPEKRDVSENRKRALNWIMRCDSILYSLTADAAANGNPGDDEEDDEDDDPLHDEDGIRP
jgi:hypothetical protein